MEKRKSEGEAGIKEAQTTNNEVGRRRSPGRERMADQITVPNLKV